MVFIGHSPKEIVMLPYICWGSVLIYVIVVVLVCIFMRSAKIAQQDMYFEIHIRWDPNRSDDANLETQRRYIQRNLSKLLLEEGGLDALEAAERRGIFKKHR